jgi:hypothetical protein
MNVFPVMSAGPSLSSASQMGQFQRMMPAQTPIRRCVE